MIQFPLFFINLNSYNVFKMVVLTTYSVIILYEQVKYITVLL